MAAGVIVEDRAWQGRLDGELRGELAPVFAQASSRLTADSRHPPTGVRCVAHFYDRLVLRCTKKLLAVLSTGRVTDTTRY